LLAGGLKTDKHDKYEIQSQCVSARNQCDGWSKDITTSHA